MANRRMLSINISKSDKLEELRLSGGEKGEFYQLLYTWMIPYTDDFGRLSATPHSVKTTVMPASNRPTEDFKNALIAMNNVGLIILYGDKNQFLEITQFEKFQSGLHKRTKSNIPDPPTGSSRKFPEVPKNPSPTEQNRTEPKKAVNSSAAAISDTDHKITVLSRELRNLGIFPDVYKFNGQMRRLRKNEGALLRCLEQCFLNKPSNPFGYCIKIMSIENGNYNEKSFKSSAVRDSDPVLAAEMLKNIASRLN